LPNELKVTIAGGETEKLLFLYLEDFPDGIHLKGMADGLVFCIATFYHGGRIDGYETINLGQDFLSLPFALGKICITCDKKWFSTLARLAKKDAAGAGS
jgi:hypothetical protein